MGTTIQAGITFNANPPALQNIAERTAHTVGGYNEMFMRFGDDLNFNLRVCMPAKVVSFNPEKQTIVAQILIREKLKDLNTGTEQFAEIAQIADIPVHYPQGGDFILTFPLKENDEVILVFADSCIDSWWYMGNIQNWIDRRRHDLSDAFAIPGVNSKPNTLYAADSNAGINEEGAELRTRDGLTKITLTDDSVTTTRSNEGTLIQTVVNNDGVSGTYGDTDNNFALTNGMFTVNAATEIILNAPQITINGTTTTMNGTVLDMNQPDVNINVNPALNLRNSAGNLFPYMEHTHRYTVPNVGTFSTTTVRDPFPTVE